MNAEILLHGGHKEDVRMIRYSDYVVIMLAMAETE